LPATGCLAPLCPRSCRHPTYSMASARSFHLTLRKIYFVVTFLRGRRPLQYLRVTVVKFTGSFYGVPAISRPPLHRGCSHMSTSPGSPPQVTPLGLDFIPTTQKHSSWPRRGLSLDLCFAHPSPSGEGSGSLALFPFSDHIFVYQLLYFPQKRPGARLVFFPPYGLSTFF